MAYEYSCTNYASPSDATPVVRQRHFYTESQLEHLEADFAVQQFPNQERRHRLAVKIGVSDKSILWWFQNRRRRARRTGNVKSVNSIQSRQRQRRTPYSLQCAGSAQNEGLESNWNDPYLASLYSQHQAFIHHLPSPEQYPIDYSTNSQHYNGSPQCDFQNTAEYGAWNPSYTEGTTSSPESFPEQQYGTVAKEDQSYSDGYSSPETQQQTWDSYSIYTEKECNTPFCLYRDQIETLTCLKYSK